MPYILYDTTTKQVSNIFYDVENAPEEVKTGWMLTQATIPDAPQASDGQVAILCYDGTQFYYNMVTIYTLADAQAVKKAELDNACEQEIEKGFSSSALGAAHTYPADDAAKTNFQLGMKRLEIANDPNATFPFQTFDAGFLPHTLAQLQQAFCDGVDYGLTIEQKKIVLYAQVDGATTTEGVAAIVWS